MVGHCAERLEPGRSDTASIKSPLTVLALSKE